MLIAYVTRVYFQAPVRVVVGSLLLMLGLIGSYSLIHVGVSRRIPFGPYLGTIVAPGLLVELYAAGASRLPILGGGKGQPAAVAFLGISFVEMARPLPMEFEDAVYRLCTRGNAREPIF